MTHRWHVLLIVAIGLFLGQPVWAAKFNKKVDIGQPAPDWSRLPGIDGKQHSLGDYADAKVLVFVFISNLCPVANAYEERLVDLAGQYKPSEMKLVAINIDSGEAESLEKMKEHAAKAGFNFDYIRDDSQQTGRKYGASCTPHVFVLDQDRRIAYMGAFDDKWIERASVDRTYVKDAVDALLAGKQPETNESRQVGCSIEYDFAEAEPSAVAETVAASREEGGTDDGKVTLEIATPDDYQSILKKHRGKVILVDFWAMWCIPCRKEFPHTVEFSGKYAKDGLVVVSMSMDEPDDESVKQSLEFLKKQKATCINLLSALGGSEESFDAYDIEGGALPHYKIYDRTGKVAKTFSSGDPDTVYGHEDIEKALRETLGLPAKD